MTLGEFLTVIAQISGLFFIVASMLAMGMSLTMGPLLAYTITRLLPLEQLPSAKQMGTRTAGAAAPAAPAAAD